jgi:hypothetical protein
MKSENFFRRYFWLSIFLFFLLINVKGQESEIYNQIKMLPEVISVQKIDHHPFFKESYEILIEQFLDHGNPAAGKFKQRIVLSDYNKYSPIVFVTEGYKADYAVNKEYINELSRILDANQIVVEHRYFGKSTPDQLNWEYLTMENAAADLNRIVRIFKRVYNNRNKWIATGISKGGTNTLAFKAFYPNACDIWVSYVGPINFKQEDGRHEKFLATVGSQTCRNRILDFQKTMLMKRDSIQPIFDSLIIARNYTFNVPNEEVLDYTVLEYSFSFWQWGHGCESIPADTVSLYEKFEHLIKVIDPEYFSIEGTEPILAFFVQAAKEMGYYGYDTKLLKPYLKIKDSKGYLSRVFLSENKNIKFNKKTSSLIEKSINSGGKHVMVIYGANDPWTASALRLKKGSKAVKFVVPKANHRVRINTIPYAQRANIYMILEAWLEED